ncbi:MAG: DsbE family thiol:disulfide interchange protein [Rhizobiaceae bacterium]|nr:DsbE family thiol:disulfide interchange protein [Rhizobiaceae bacterium]
MNDSPSKKPNLWFAILPLAVFLALTGVFYSLLSTEGRDTSALPSALLNDPAPVLIVPPLSETGLPGLEADTFKSGKVSVVNIFASWCVPCRQEHPQIVKLGEDERIQLVGINHKDSTSNALTFLSELGNPYDVIGVDRSGRAAIEWGVYGVPETFLVDGSGVVFYKHVGPISPQQLEEQIMPLLEQKLANAT